MTREEEDYIHEHFGAVLMTRLLSGTQAPPPNNRWKISWLCGKCDNIHEVTGDIAQIQNTFTAFLVLGYPLVKIEDAGFAELRAADGLGDNTMEDLQQASKNFKEFWETTRRS